MKKEKFFKFIVQKKKKDVDGIMTGVSVRKVLTMFVQSSSILLFITLRRGWGYPRWAKRRRVGVDQVAFKSSWIREATLPYKTMQVHLSSLPNAEVLSFWSSESVLLWVNWTKVSAFDFPWKDSLLYCVLLSILRRRSFGKFLETLLHTLILWPERRTMQQEFQPLLSN